MIDILLVGLSDPEAGAIEVLMGRRWPNLATHRLPRGPRMALPEQDHAARNCAGIVIDLLSTGLRTRTPEAEAALLQFLAGRPGILLSRDSDCGWAGSALPTVMAQQIAVIKSPYSSAQLLAALVQMLDPEHRSAAVKHAAPPTPRNTRPAVGSEPTLPAWQRALALAERLNQHEKTANGASAPTKSNGAAPVMASAGAAARQSRPQGVGIRKGAVPALLHVFPQLRTQPLMLLSERILAAGDAVMLHLSNSVAIVICVQQGWAATGLRLPMLKRMLADTKALDQITLQSLTNAEAEKVVRERFGAVEHRMRMPLDTLTWELAATWFPTLKLHPHGDLQLRLKRLPNFTRIDSAGPLDVQLAAACVRQPQSLMTLAQQFPGREQEVYRFAVLALLSGAAQVMPENKALPAPATLLPNDAQRRGFFKSLLDRLF